MVLDIARAARISPNGAYRYSLSRTWGAGAPLVFVMLNPSTADATVDDPTIRRCMGFARREGAPGIRVVNLFAFRSTKPEGLLLASDPIGPDNDAAIEWACREASKVIVAWGVSGPALVRRHRVAAVRFALAGLCDLWCLGTTASGAPCHPLYLSADAPLRLYQPRRAGGCIVMAHVIVCTCKLASEGTGAAH